MGRCLLFRADADEKIGTGHVMRLLALAQAWKAKGNKSIFLMASSQPGIEERIQREGMEVMILNKKAGSAEDAAITSKTVKSQNASWLVLDGYHFDQTYQKKIQAEGIKILYLDDEANHSPYVAELILNQNLHARSELYGIASDRLLLGNRYTLLRHEFLKEKGRVRSGKIQNFLITLGGSDPQNVTLKCLHALEIIKPQCKVTVVLGACNPHKEEIVKSISHTVLNIEIVEAVENMPSLMAKSDAAFAAAGSTSWELCFMGVPSLYVAVAENQIPLAESLQAHGAGLNLGWHADLTVFGLAASLRAFLEDDSQRKNISKKAIALFDGKGAERVLSAINAASIHFRIAAEADCEQIWKWANHPNVRQVSFSTKEIPWEDHVNWFQSKRVDPKTKIWIAESEDRTQLGELRCDYGNGTATLSIIVDPDQQKKGYGTAMIQKAANEIFQNSSIKSLQAYVKPLNKASVRAFQKAGFEEQGETMINSCKASYFLLKRNRYESLS